MGQTFYSTPQEYAERYLSNNKTIKKHKEDKIKEVKLSIISLAYTPSLSHGDLYELSEVIDAIAQNKECDKKQGVKK